MRQNKIYMFLLSVIVLISSVNAVQDVQWSSKFSSKSTGFWYYDGQSGTDVIKVTGALQQTSQSIYDMQGEVEVKVYENKKIKMYADFVSSTFSIHGVYPDGTYYVYGYANIYYYQNGRVVEKLKDVAMQLSFNPVTSEFKLATTVPKTIIIRTVMKGIDFANYRGFDCEYVYADSFDGVYGEDEWVCRNGYVYTYASSGQVYTNRIAGEVITSTDEGYLVTEYGHRIYVWQSWPDSSIKTWSKYYIYERSPNTIELDEARHIL